MREVYCLHAVSMRTLGRLRVLKYDLQRCAALNNSQWADFYSQYLHTMTNKNSIHTDLRISHAASQRFAALLQSRVTLSPPRYYGRFRIIRGPNTFAHQSGIRRHNSAARAYFGFD